MAPPQGSRIYIANNAYKFWFLGALEVFTREALDTYFEHADECSKNIGKEGGEDYYMKSCMDGLGIDYIKDFELLRDRYAAQNGCGFPWVAAFHYAKRVKHWNNCWNEANNAQKAADAAQSCQADRLVNASPPLW